MAPSGINLENESLDQVSDSISKMSYPCSNCPWSRVLHQFLRHETMKMPSMSRGQVRTEKGKLKGSTYSMPTQMTVETTKMILALTVQTPPHFELLFQSCTRKQERVTPGMITSITGSQEHFLKRLLTRSGTQKKRGEESSPAQSLYESGRRKCRMMQTTVTVATMIAMARQLSLRELKWKILMLPTQMHPARMLQRIQLSQKQARMTRNTATTPLMASHCLIILQTGFRSRFMRQMLSFRQMKTKNNENMIPKYLMTVNDFHRSRQVEKQRESMSPTPTALKIRKFFHFRTYLKGLWLIRIDQTCECMATPTIMHALMSAMKRQPTQNCLCLFLGSQFIRKLKRTPWGSSRTVALLKQLQAEQDPPSHPQLQLKEMLKCVSFNADMKGCGQALGKTDMAISLGRRAMFQQATVSLPPRETSIILRLPLRQLRPSLNVASSQLEFKSPLLKISASSQFQRISELATRREMGGVCVRRVMSRQEKRMKMGLIYIINLQGKAIIHQELQ